MQIHSTPYFEWVFFNCPLGEFDRLGHIAPPELEPAIERADEPKNWPLLPSENQSASRRPPNPCQTWPLCNPRPHAPPEGRDQSPVRVGFRHALSARNHAQSAGRNRSEEHTS